MKRDLSSQRARELFDYSPETGELRWKDPGDRRKNPVGTKNHYGYLVVTVDGRQIKVHRIIWALAWGAPGDLLIDHINRVRYDNRLANLRLCTNGENIRNSKVSKRSALGVRGVRLKRKSYLARIGRTHLGSFTTLEDAIRARVEAARVIHGEFAPSEVQ